MTGFVWHGDHAVSRGLTIGISQEDSSALAATPIKAITRSALSEPRRRRDGDLLADSRLVGRRRAKVTPGAQPRLRRGWLRTRAGHDATPA